MTLIYTVYFMYPYFPIYMLLYSLFPTHTILVSCPAASIGRLSTCSYTTTALRCHPAHTPRRRPFEAPIF